MRQPATNSVTALSLNPVAWAAHALIAGIGIFSSDYHRVDQVNTSRAVTYLQHTDSGQRLSRLLRISFVPLCVLTIVTNFTGPGCYVDALRLTSSLLFATVAILGPLAFAALSYRRWVLILLVISGGCELLQLSPYIPGQANILDFVVTAAFMLIAVGLGLWLRYLSPQDFEDRPLWAEPWQQSSRRSKETEAGSDTVLS